MKILHTSITVKDMKESIMFYQNVMGLELVRRREIPENNAEIAFLRDPDSKAQIELTYWKEKTDWTSGDELDHIAFGVQDMDRVMRKLKNMNVEVAKEPYTLQGSKTRIAFIIDPNGIWIELVELAS